MLRCWCVSKFVKSCPLEIILATGNNLWRVAQIIHSWQAFWPCSPLQWKGGHWLWFDNCNVCCDMFSKVFWFSLVLCATHFNRHLISGNDHDNRCLLLFYSKIYVNLFVLHYNFILNDYTILKRLKTHFHFYFNVNTLTHYLIIIKILKWI